MPTHDAPQNTAAARSPGARKSKVAAAAAPPTAAARAVSREIAARLGVNMNGLALPTEDQGQIDALLATLLDEIAPQTAMGTTLVQLLAVAQMRLDRMDRYQKAMTAFRVRHAGEDFTEFRLAEADHHMNYLAQEPKTHHRGLLRTPEGIDRLLGTLDDIRTDLLDPAMTWNHVHESCLANAFGCRPSEYPRPRGVELSRALMHDPSLLTDDDRAVIIAECDGDMALWARPRMTAYLDAEIERLRAVRQALEPAIIERDRAEATDRALFDPGRDAALARRYEASVQRDYHRFLRAIREVEAQFAPRTPDAAPVPESAPAPAAVPPVAPLPPVSTVRDHPDHRDDIRIVDPADRAPRPRPRRDLSVRPPLASFGITAEDESRRLGLHPQRRPLLGPDGTLPGVRAGKPPQP